MAARTRGVAWSCFAASAASLRIVSDELWHAAHARVEKTVKSYLRRGNQLVGKGAREQRAAERANLLAEIPKLAGTEARLVRRIATVEDDALVGALKGEWEAKASREWAERRVAELEGIERDLAADRSEVEALRETWKSWSAALEKATYAPAGSVPAEARAQARQILRKVLVGTIEVTPLAEKIDGRPSWSFLGFSRFDGVILGGLTKGESFNVVLHDAKTGEVLTQDVDTLVRVGYRPISGGSDAGCGTGRDTDGPPSPQRSETPRRSRGAPRCFVTIMGASTGPHAPPPRRALRRLSHAASRVVAACLPVRRRRRRR